MTTEAFLFFTLAIFTIATAILMIVQRNPIMSALYLIATFFFLSAIYLLLQAQLLAVLQVAVYAGAIMVLVVFVVMLLNLGEKQKIAAKIDIRRLIGVAVAFGFLLELLYLFLSPNAEQLPGVQHPSGAALGSAEGMGSTLFTQYILPFEVTSLLLLAAIVGAVILAKRQT